MALTDLLVKLSGDASGLKAALQQSEAQMEKFGGFAKSVGDAIRNPLDAAGGAIEGFLTKLGPLGTMATGAAGAFAALATSMIGNIREIGEYADRVQDASIRMGMSTQDVGRFSFAMKVAGGSIDDLEATMRMLSQGLDENSEKGKLARDALASLGIQGRNADGTLRPMRDIFLEISQALSQIEDPAHRNTLAIQLFGRAGLQVLPDVLDLQKNYARAVELGVGKTEKQIEELNRLGEKVRELDARWQAFGRNIKITLAEAAGSVFFNQVWDTFDKFEKMQGESVGLKERTFFPSLSFTPKDRAEAERYLEFIKRAQGVKPLEPGAVVNLRIAGAQPEKADVADAAAAVEKVAKAHILHETALQQAYRALVTFNAEEYRQLEIMRELLSAQQRKVKLDMEGYDVLRDLAAIGTEHNEVQRTGADIIEATEKSASSLGETMRSLAYGTVAADEAMARLNAEYYVFSQRIPMQKISLLEAQPGYARKDMAKDLYGGAKQSGNEFLQMVSTIRTDFSRSITDMIFEGGKFGDIVANVFKEAGKAFTRYLIEGALKKFGSELAKLMPGVSSLTKYLGGGASSAAPGGASALLSGGGGGGSAFGSAGGAMAGWGSALISGGLAMAGSLISGFMTKSALNKVAAQTANMVQVGMTQQDTFNRYLSALPAIHERLMEIITYGVWVKGRYENPVPVEIWGGPAAAGGGGVNINITGGYFLSDRAMDDFVNAMVDRLRKLGLIK